MMRTETKFIIGSLIVEAAAGLPGRSIGQASRQLSVSRSGRRLRFRSGPDRRQAEGGEQAGAERGDIDRERYDAAIGRLDDMQGLRAPFRLLMAPGIDRDRRLAVGPC